MIIIDESSQHPEYNFLTLLSIFPKTRFCLIGDDKQLTPYSSAPSESKITSIGRRSVLDVLVNQAALGSCNLSKLLTTFRCHPSILELPNELFYSKTLISGCSAESKSSVLKKLKFPNPHNPMAFIDVKSTHYKSENSLSCGNDKERDKCVELIKLLLKNECVTAQNLAVVSFYAEQRMRLSEDLKKDEITKEVRVNTVDSVQGAEFEVVILLTTKTAFAKKEPFLTNPNRINVAITRAKHALFIMGRELTLRSLPVWRDLIAFCEKNAGMLGEKDIPQLF
ncbi:unnamed protein product [Auanema sp. JU1783]|nr:unnamed protein product [Auanema sp. JU1783]